jgi:hypothetical protein
LHAPLVFTAALSLFRVRICDFGFFFPRRAASRISLLASRDARAAVLRRLRGLRRRSERAREERTSKERSMRHFEVRGVGRRVLGAGIALLAGAFVAIPVAANDERDCAGQRSLRLVNGRIHTMDRKDTVVSSVLMVTIADIKPGDGLGTTAVARPDGTLVAREIHTFPPSLGVPNEGSRPWDDAGASMTNARVSAVVQATEGRELTLTWKDGSRKLVVPENTPIVTGVDADRTFLRPGEYVYLNAQAGADGTLTAIGRVQVSKDGVRPPQ